MNKLDIDTIIDTIECVGCGIEVPVKVRPSGNLGCYCAKVVGVNEQTGKKEQCFSRINWGRTSSQRLIENFINNQPKERQENVITTEIKQPIEEVTATEPEQQPERRNALLHFLTGDE
jgi:hypothetical protein